MERSVPMGDEHLNKKRVDLTDLTPAMTRELNEIAESCRGEYMKLMNCLSEKYGKEGFWWDTQLASRHIGCSCFEDICKLKLLRALEDRSEADEVITDSRVMYRMIKRNLSLSVSIKKKKESMKSRVWRSAPVQLLYNYQRFAGRVRRYRSDPSLRRSVPVDSDVILVSECAMPSELKDGVFTDRYFPEMRATAPEKTLYVVNMVYSAEQEVVALSEYLSSRSDFAICDCFSTKEDLEEVRRYIRWCRHFKLEPCFFDGLDITELLQHHLSTGAHSSVSIVGILKGNAICRMVKEQKLRVIKLIDWFEGQASSSAIVRRFRKAYSNVPTMSYINSPCGENNLGLYPISEQYHKNVISEFFGTQGICWENMIKRFCPDTKCVTVPSYRQLAVFREDDRWKRERNGILITVPYFMDVAESLLHDFFSAIKDSGRFRIYIKNHPAKENYKLQNYGIGSDEYCGHDIHYIGGELSEALEGKRAVIMSKTTMALEVMLTGVYTILYLGRGELSNFCLPDGMEKYRNVACDANELKQLLSGDMRGLDQSEAEKLRDKVFAKVDEFTVKAMFN